MKALVFDGELKIEDRPRPTPKKDEALIRVIMAGICRTDAEIIKGYMNFSGILGHEFVGVVEDAPKASLLGKRVVGEINCGCGECDLCRIGLSRHCHNRTVLGIKGRAGAFAEYVTLPVDNVFLVPDDVRDESAVFVEPLAAALEILEQIHVEPTDTIAVIGDGKLGLLVSMVLRLTGADVVLIGKHLEKIAIFERTGGRGITSEQLPGSSDTFSKIVEASGNPSGWKLAVDHISPRGTIVLKSTYHGGISTDLSTLVINEIKVLGSRCGPFAPALRLLAKGLVNPSPLISEVYPFQDALKAFQKAVGRGVLKVLLRM